MGRHGCASCRYTPTQLPAQTSAEAPLKTTKVLNFSGLAILARALHLTSCFYKGKPVERRGRKTSGLTARSLRQRGCRDRRRIRLVMDSGTHTFRSFAQTTVELMSSLPRPGYRGRIIRGLHEESQTGVWIAAFCLGWIRCSRNSYAQRLRRRWIDSRSDDGKRHVADRNGRRERRTDDSGKRDYDGYGRRCLQLSAAGNRCQ